MTDTKSPAPSSSYYYDTPRFTINLDLPPQQRWTHVLNSNVDYYSKRGLPSRTYTQMFAGMK
jgi:hypothetical protein